MKTEQNVEMVLRAKEIEIHTEKDREIKESERREKEKLRKTIRNRN